MKTTMKTNVTYCFNSNSDQRQETREFETEVEATAFLTDLMSKDSEVCGISHTPETSPDTEEILRACGVTESRLEELGVIQQVTPNSKKTITTSQEFILRFEETNKPTFALGMSAEIAGGCEFIPGFELSENDGLSCTELFPAVAHLFPKGTKAESNGRNDSWISHWNSYDLAEMGGKSFRIRVTRRWLLDENERIEELENQKVELIA